MVCKWLTMDISTSGSSSSPPRNGSPPIPAWEAPAANDPYGSEAVHSKNIKKHKS